MRPEPKYYKQLRELNVRLLWNMNQHELPTSLPFVRTIWDVNHCIHSMYPEYSYTRFTFDGCDGNMAYSLARASYVIVGTEEGKRQVVSMFGVHEGKVRVIPFPTPVLSVSRQCSQQVSEAIHHSPYLFYPARFWPHKNHVVILAALKVLRDQRNIRLRCILSGADEGNLRYVLQYAEKLGVGDQVKYLGVVSDEDLASLYSGALALVYASAVGPDNLPPLEAMSLDCPVITARVPGAREQYGDAALYFDPMSEHELADCINQLLDNKSVREKLMRNGRARAASWTVQDYANAVVSVFDEFASIARAWERCDSVFT
jgi:glycosyltransferase involved in cell wall biosynthesis